MTWAVNVLLSKGNANGLPTHIISWSESCVSVTGEFININTAKLYLLYRCIISNMKYPTDIETEGHNITLKHVLEDNSL